jgi:hypothetical protein
MDWYQHATWYEDYSVEEYFLKLNTHKFNQIANYVNNIDKNSNQLEIYIFIKKLRINFNIHSQIIVNLENNEDYLTMPIMFISTSHKKINLFFSNFLITSNGWWEILNILFVAPSIVCRFETKVTLDLSYSSQGYCIFDMIN